MEDHTAVLPRRNLTPAHKAALAYVGDGYPVLPIKPNRKQPLTAHGLRDASTYAEVIGNWWKRHPAANVAIRTDGLLVLDIDDAASDWPHAADQRRDLDNAPTQRTPRGGLHHFFLLPGGVQLRNTTGKLAPKIDTRANGGYIIVAPSIVDGHPYEWLRALPPRHELPEAPAWLIEALCETKRAPAAPTNGNGNRIPEGKRNGELTALAGAMRRRGAGADEITAALRATNRTRCAPPLPEHEVERIAASVARYEPGEGVRPVLVNMADVKPEAIEWLWPGRIARGKLTLIVGVPGEGKSTLAIDLVARVSTGTAWPDRLDERREPAGAIIMSAEDADGDTVRPRLDAAGADCNRINSFPNVERAGAVRPFTLADLPALELAIAQTPGCALVVIDPITAYMGGSIDGNDNLQVRAALTPLAALAQRARVAIVCISHTRKTAGPAIHATLGSTAFGATVRAVWCVVRDRQDRTRRLLLMVKNNVAPDEGGLAFGLATAANGVGVVAWETGVVTLTADEALAPPPADTDASGAVGDAVEWLRDHLADGVERAARDIKAAAAAECGPSWASIQRARKAAGVVAVRRGYGAEGRWCWRLPKSDPPIDAQPPQGEENVRTFGEAAHLCVFDPENADISATDAADSPKVRNPESLRTYGADCSPAPTPGGRCPVIVEPNWTPAQKLQWLRERAEANRTKNQAVAVDLDDKADRLAAWIQANPQAADVMGGVVSDPPAAGEAAA